MENFLDFIKGDIESKTTFLDSQPVNTKTNIKTEPMTTKPDT